jgi:hypothetical protein
MKLLYVRSNVTTEELSDELKIEKGKLPHQLLFYFFEISNGKKLHEETQQY